MILPYERHLKGEKDHPEVSHKVVKRGSRGLYKDQISEQHAQEEKKPRIWENSKKTKSYLAPHNITALVTGFVPNFRDQRLWQQEHQLVFSRLTPLITFPLSGQSKQTKSQHAQYTPVNQQIRSSIGPPRPQESQQSQQEERLEQMAREESINEQEELPLNLSAKRQASEVLKTLDFKSDSSSSSKCTIPKFLNQVSPLYPSHPVKKMKNQVTSSGNNGQGRILSSKALLKPSKESLFLPVAGSHMQQNAQLLKKSEGQEIAEARGQTLLNLNSSHHTKKIPYVERTKCYSIPEDIGYCRFSRATPQPWSQCEVTPPTSISQGLYTFPQSSPYRRATQLPDRAINQKTEHSYKETKSNGLSNVPSDLSSYRYTKQNQVRNPVHFEGEIVKTNKQQFQLSPAMHVKVRPKPVIAFARVPTMEKVSLHKGLGDLAGSIKRPQLDGSGSSFPSVSYDNYPGGTFYRLHKTISSRRKPEQCNQLEYPQPFCNRSSKLVCEKRDPENGLHQISETKYWNQVQTQMGYCSLKDSHLGQVLQVAHHPHASIESR
ncbi:uncharacterized protein LOC115087814 isoform X2 [Rhinatrema bivittatum]|nr:uncharacterized protein LOC115087814 isoform X2 [Rhinatrema bivittatum]